MLSKILKTVGAVVIAVLVYTYVWYSEVGALQGLTDSIQQMAIFVCITLVCAYSIFWINYWFRSRQIQATGSMVLLVVCLLSLLVTAALFATAFSVLQRFDVNLFPLSAGSPYGAELLIKIGLLMFVVVVAYNVGYFVLFAYNEYGTSKIKQATRDRQLLEAQLALLRAQLSPHYLFNCLNTISSLLHKDTKQAELFIRRLAQTFQYIFKNQNMTLVPVKSEMAFVEAYYYLLQVRFEGQIQLHVSLDKPILNCRIPPLSLQLLVENAVKHNRPTLANPLKIEISGTGSGYISVVNNIHKQSAPVESFKIGLDNLKERYRFLTRSQVKTKQSHQFKVEIPVMH